MFPGRWRPRRLSFPQRPCRKAGQVTWFGSGQSHGPHTPGEQEGCDRRHEGLGWRGWKEGPQQMQPRAGAGFPDPRRGHGALDIGAVVLPLSHRPPLSILPAPSLLGLTRTPGRCPLISVHPKEKGLISLSGLGSERLPRGHIPTTDPRSPSRPPRRHA